MADNNIEGLIGATTMVQNSSANTVRSVEHSRSELENRTRYVSSLMQGKQSATAAVGAMQMAASSLADVISTLQELQTACGDYIAYLRS